MDLNALYERDPERTRDAFKFGSMSAEIIDLKEQLFALRSSATASAGERVAGLSQQQIHERMRSGLCMRCGQPGHFKKDCPSGQQ